MHRIKAFTAHRDSGLYLAIAALLFAVVFFVSALSTVHTPFDATPTPNTLPVVAVMLPTESLTPTLIPTSTPTALPLAPVPPTLTPSQPAMLTHVVQFGDTLYAISQRYGVPMDVVAAVNNLPTLTSINVGQVLNIPVDPVMATSAANGLPTPNADGQIIVTATPAPNWMVNGVALESIFALSPSVLANITQIYAYGQSIGRNPRAFSKLGDSTIENPHFLARFDEGTYNLGPYAFLQPTIDYFRGSFGRQGATVRRGLHTWSVLDPMWATGCADGQHMLQCEFEQHNPAFIIIRLGSNDAGIPDAFDRNLREIVEFCIQSGVVPILGTKADRFEGAGNINNDIIRRIAHDYQLPLWDFDLIAATIPNRGLGADNVHMTTFFAHDWNLSSAYTTGVGVHNITALMMLDKLRQAFAAP